MKFGNPGWLWAFLVLPFVCFFLFYDQKLKQKSFAQFIDRKLWPVISPDLDFKLKYRKIIALILAFGFLFLALARPQFGTHEETVKVSGLDILFVLDASNSMEVADVIPSRLQKAKHMMRSILGRLGGDRVGVVAFAGSSYVLCPLTTDLDYVLDRIQTISPRMVQNQGTDIGLGLETAAKALERGAEDSSPQPNPSLSNRAIILISDGEDHESEAMKQAALLKEKDIKFYAFGVGTPAGGPIPVKEGEQSIGFRRDSSGSAVISTFHSDFLSKLAVAAGGKYWTVTEGENEVLELLNEMGTLNRSDYAERKYLVYEEKFQIPLFLSILLFMLELSIPARRIGAIVLIFISLSSERGWADSASLDTYFENKKGLRAFEAGDLKEAQKSFGAAQARDPTRPELQFNQGVVQMQQGQADLAAEAFKEAARGAARKNDRELLGKSLYNLGSSLAKKGDNSQAAQSYIEAIQAAIQNKDQKLEAEARKNLQLLMEQEEKKKEEQKQDQKEKDQKQQDQKQQDQKQQDQKQQDQKQQDQKQQDQKQQDQKEKDKKQQGQQDQKSDQQKDQKQNQEQEKENQRQFNSKDLDKQDADRVLNELKAKESELQERLNTKNAKSQRHAKDW